AGSDRLGRTCYRLHSRSTKAVYRLTGYLHRQAREESGHPGNIPVVLARLIAAAQDDVFDFGGREVGLFHQPLDGSSGEVIWPNFGQSTGGLGDGSAYCSGDNDFGHGGFSVLDGEEDSG